MPEFCLIDTLIPQEVLKELWVGDSKMLSNPKEKKCKEKRDAKLYILFSGRSQVEFGGSPTALSSSYAQSQCTIKMNK